jgi:uncharacterized FlaG/YvyC family protein
MLIRLAKHKFSGNWVGCADVEFEAHGLSSVAEMLSERRFMEVPPISAADLSSSPTARQSDAAQSVSLRNAFTAARQLNNLDIADREFSVVRDPQSHRFVVVVVERSTGTVLDQFPPENILRMLSQVSTGATTAGAAKQTGETSE